VHIGCQQARLTYDIQGSNTNNTYKALPVLRNRQAQTKHILSSWQGQGFSLGALKTLPTQVTCKQGQAPTHRGRDPLKALHDAPQCSSQVPLGGTASCTHPLSRDNRKAVASTSPPSPPANPPTHKGGSFPVPLSSRIKNQQGSIMPLTSETQRWTGVLTDPGSP